MFDEMRSRANLSKSFGITSLFNYPAEVEKSMAFIAYKLMWYIEQCFKGKKYPQRIKEDDRKIGEKQWAEVVYMILNNLLLVFEKKSNLKELMEIDTICMLKVFKALFETPAQRKFLTDPKSYGGTEENSHTRIFEKLIDAVNSQNDSSAKYKKIALYKLLAEVNAYTDMMPEPELCESTLQFLATPTQEEEGKTIDRKEFEKLIMNMLKNCKQMSLENSRIDKLIRVYADTGYTDVLIHLRELKGEYTECFKIYVNSKDREINLKIFEWLKRIHMAFAMGDGAETKNDLSAAIIDKLEILLSFDIRETTNIVDTWFQHQHEKVIEKLSARSELQLEYLLRVLKDKEADIEKVFKEGNIGADESEQYTQYKKWIIKSVELLCQYRPEDVVPHIKKKYYPASEILPVVEARNHLSGRAYLLKRTGMYVDSLKVYLEILNAVGDKLLDEKQRDFIDKNEGQYKDVFSRCLKVCNKNAKVTRGEEKDQGVWFTMLDSIYEMWLKLFHLTADISADSSKDKLGMKSLQYKKVGELYSECINKLLTDMMNSVSFPTILSRMSDNHGELELASFKEVFTTMIASYFYQEKIFETAKKIVGNSIVQNFQSVCKYRSRGITSTEVKCDKCEALISNKSNEMIATYQCGHLYHLSCTAPKLPCYYCTYKEKKGVTVDKMLKKGGKEDDGDEGRRESSKAGRTEEEAEEKKEKAKEKKDEESGSPGKASAGGR